MLPQKYHDGHNTKTPDENDWRSDNLSEETFTDLLTLSEFTEQKKFVRSNRKPNLTLVGKVEQNSVSIVSKSIYDPISSEEEDEPPEVEKLSDSSQQPKTNVPRGRGFVIQKFDAMRKVANNPTDDIINDIRKIYPFGNSDNVIAATLNRKTNNPKVVKSDYERFKDFENGSSTSTSSSSYGPYVPKYEEKPNVTDLNQFPSLSGGKKKQNVCNDAVTKPSAGCNRKFKTGKKVNFRDSKEFPSLW